MPFNVFSIDIFLSGMNEEYTNINNAAIIFYLFIHKIGVRLNPTPFNLLIMSRKITPL